MNTPSLSFDRAASYYDATRALQPDLARQLTDALEREIRRAGGRVLEPGIGTGRIARPLMERGIHVTGVDISPKMLHQLVAQLTAAHTPPDLILGDTTRLPLAGGSFGAVMVCHLLHLIQEWPRAIAEIRRALAPGGVVLHHGEGESDRNRSPAMTAKIDELLAKRGFTRRRRPGEDDIRAGFAAAGGNLRTETVAEWDDTRTLDRHFIESRSRAHSWTWEIPEDIFSDMMDEFEPWARACISPDRHVTYEVDVWTFD
ncbi:MAG TPA: class I SAM-dependent methyltransferase [Dehalococcoidia bacterium]|nr:class I SAM-dependent methyltransferase [Dehalococcoidia bacterium]